MSRPVKKVENVMIVPAAGLGTRLRASTPKLLLPVHGKAMIDWILDLYGLVVHEFVLVLHPSFEGAVHEHCRRRSNVAYARQENPSGMLDAILAPLEQVRQAAPNRVWITWCDQIAIHPDTMTKLAELSRQGAATAVILPTARRESPYIHMVRNPAGRISEIRQRREGDELPPVGESDVGLFSLSPDAYFNRLTEFAAVTASAPRTRERNFLPFLPWLSQRGEEVKTFPCRDAEEAVGVNTPDDIAVVERYLRERGDPAVGS